MSRLAAVFLLSSVLLTSNLVAAAPTPDLVTIKFPAADSAPISAKVLGDDGQGHTTYEVEAVVTMGGTTIPSFTATATVVAGSDYVSVAETAMYTPAAAMVFNDLACSISGDNASCVMKTMSNGQVVTATATMPVASLQNEVLDVAAGSGSGTASATATPVSGAVQDTGAGAANGGTSAADSSQPKSSAPSAAFRMQVGTGGVGLTLLVASFLGALLVL